MELWEPQQSPVSCHSPQLKNITSAMPVKTTVAKSLLGVQAKEASAELFAFLCVLVLWDRAWASHGLQALSSLSQPGQ